MENRPWFFTLFLLISFSGAYAQKSDYIWLSGYGSSGPADSSIQGWRFGNTKMDFSYSPVHVNFDSLPMNFDVTNTSYCDSDGNLLFYSDGLFVANYFNEMMANGDSLNPGYWRYVWDTTIQYTGYRNGQGILALQSLSAPNQYYLVHTLFDTIPGLQGAAGVPELLLTLVDMSENGGHGKVIYKNRPLINGIMGTEISATKHGNGKDWWILVQKNNSNCYYSVLLTDTGFAVDSTLNCLGATITLGDGGASCFSPDGSKYVYLSGYTGINLYDFDRCTGRLSNPLRLPLPVLTDSGWIGLGVAISASSQFLYAAITKQLYQFDLWNANIFNTIDTVGFYDGYREPFGSYFVKTQLAPDGKIYISCGNSEADYHVINNPDIGGDSCNFVQHGLHLPTISSGVPNYPNYRLGPLAGGACDTLAGLNETARAAKEKIIKIFPNPASDYSIIDYGFTDWSKGPVSLQISNELGQIVFAQTLPIYSGYQKIDMSEFASGFYYVAILRNNGIVGVGKLVKSGP